MRQTFGRFADVVKFLKKSIPPAFPVSARRKYGLPEDTAADCELVERDGKKKFIIRITRKVSNDISVLLILHEWAHAMCWQEDAKIELHDHGPEWGLAYSRVWYTFEKFLDEPSK